MRDWLSNKALMILLISAGVALSACDKGKKPYEEAEALFSKSDYAAAKNKAAEVIEKAPKSKYLAQATELIQKIDKIEKLLQTGQADIENGDYEKGIGAYKEVLSIDPKNKAALEAKEKAERVLAEIANSEKSNVKAQNMIITIITADTPLLQGEDGDYYRFPNLKFSITNKSPFPVKILSAEVQYKFKNMIRQLYDPKYALYLDRLQINKILLSGNESLPIISKSKKGVMDNYPNTWERAYWVEITVNTTVGKIYKEDYI